MRGRKPKPTALKIAEGNPGRRPLNMREPRPARGPIVCPDHLAAGAKRAWRRIFPLLDEAAIITAVDIDLLSMFCETLARWIEAEKNLRTDGIIITSTTGAPYQNPWLGVCNTAMRLLVKIGSELGLSPTARSRLTTDGPDRGPDLDTFVAELKRPD